MNNDDKLKEILSKLDSDELEELLNIVKEKKQVDDPTRLKRGRYSMTELDDLIKYYPLHGPQWCASYLNRNLISIQKKSSELSLAFTPMSKNQEEPDIFRPNKIYASPIDTTTPRQNLFLNFKPTKKEKTDFTKDSLIDNLLSKDLTPTSRNRNPNMIQIECSKCHKSMTINKKIVGSIERFKCNRCMVRNR